MPRNAGSVVDTRALTVLDRDGRLHPLNRMELADGVLYHARFVDFHLFDYHERWLLPEHGWAISRLRFFGDPHQDWYIEPDLIAVEDHLWTVRDGYLDVNVDEGQRYWLDDADELAEGLGAGDITLVEAMAVLSSFHSLQRALRECNYSGQALLDRYAPDLAHFSMPAREA